MGRFFRAFIKHHLQALLGSLGRMSRVPFTSMLTIFVIGIALALPTGLHIVLKNVQQVSSGWENVAQISLFLKKDLTQNEISQFSATLLDRPEIETVNFMSPGDALDEFRQFSGFSDVLNALQENPLPSVLIIQPSLDYSSPFLVEQLLGQLRGDKRVDLAQLDMEWVKRLFGIIEVGKRGVYVLAALLALAVLLTIGNTIRLAVQSRREEIEVQKLIGATDAFIRRPFLYSGFWYGLCGALIAWILVNVALLLVNGPVKQLSLLYQSQFSLDSLGIVTTFVLLITGILLGWLGARTAVGHHIREIEPT